MEGNTTRADNVQPWLPKIIFASGRSDTTPMTVFAERCCCTEKETTHVPIAGIIGALDEIHAFDLREAVEECTGYRNRVRRGHDCYRFVMFQRCAQCKEKIPDATVAEVERLERFERPHDCASGVNVRDLRLACRQKRRGEPMIFSLTATDVELRRVC